MYFPKSFEESMNMTYYYILLYLIYNYILFTTSLHRNASKGEGSLPEPARGEAGDNREDVQAPCDAGSCILYPSDLRSNLG